MLIWVVMSLIRSDHIGLTMRTKVLEMVMNYVQENNASRKKKKNDKK